MTAAREMLEGLYRHSQFANARLLDQAERLTGAQLDAERPGAFGSIRVTLIHMMQAQYSWLRRFQMLDPVEPWPESAFPSIAALRGRWEPLDTETLAVVTSFSDQELLERIRMRAWSGWEIEAPRWQALIHQALHQHQHRGEIAMVLTTLGYSPGEIDGFDWFEIEGGAIDLVPRRH